MGLKGERMRFFEDTMSQIRDQYTRDELISIESF